MAVDEKWVIYDNNEIDNDWNQRESVMPSYSQKILIFFVVVLKFSLTSSLVEKELYSIHL